mgnify:CR=1 FL=1
MCFIAYTAFKKTACGNFADSFYFIISSIITSSIRSTLSCFFGVSLSSFPSTTEVCSILVRGITSFSTSFGSAPNTFNSFTNVSIVGVFTSRSIAPRWLVLISTTIECKSNDFRKPYDSYLYSHRTPSETWKENRVITEVC